MITLAADLADSINVENGAIWGHYDPVENPVGTRLKAVIQEAGNASTAVGLVGQTVSLDPNQHVGVWALSGTYGAFTPLMYLPARVWSQQNQDSPFRVGVLNILAGHSGPETAADARTHFGIFSPQVWNLFPRHQVINLSFWDYNDVASGYFAAVEIAARDPKVGVIVLQVARPVARVALLQVRRECVGVLELGERTLKLEFSVGECSPCQVEELAAEDAAQHPDGQEEARTTGYPPLTAERHTAARDHAVDVRVMMEILAPGV